LDDDPLNAQPPQGVSSDQLRQYAEPESTIRDGDALPQTVSPPDIGPADGSSPTQMGDEETDPATGSWFRK